MSSILRLTFLGLFLTTAWALAQDSTTDIKWSEERSGLQIGLPVVVVANRDYPTAATAQQPLVIQVRNATDASLFYVQSGRFAGFDFHFLADDGQKPVITNERQDTPTLVELEPGETKTIEVEIPSSELKHFELPLVASLELIDRTRQTRQRVYSPAMTFLATD